MAHRPPFQIAVEFQGVKSLEVIDIGEVEAIFPSCGYVVKTAKYTSEAFVG